MKFLDGLTKQEVMRNHSLRFVFEGDHDPGYCDSTTDATHW
jgi:hypothetical protein